MAFFPGRKTTFGTAVLTDQTRGNVQGITLGENTVNKSAFPETTIMVGAGVVNETDCDYNTLLGAQIKLAASVSNFTINGYGVEVTAAHSAEGVVSGDNIQITARSAGLIVLGTNTQVARQTTNVISLGRSNNIPAGVDAVEYILLLGPNMVVDPAVIEGSIALGHDLTLTEDRQMLVGNPIDNFRIIATTDDLVQFKDNPASDKTSFSLQVNVGGVISFANVAISTTPPAGAKYLYVP